MYKEKKRERRRRDYLRMKARAKIVQRRWSGDSATETEIEMAGGQLANNIKICSCSLCGNPRHTLAFGTPLTRQELKANLDKEDQYKEFLYE